MQKFAVLSLLLLSFSTQAQIVTGPGLPNQAWADAQVFEPVGFIESPEGHGNVTMLHGYLLTIYSSDGGGTADNGGIELWDLSDPMSPVLFRRYDDADTHGLREAHGYTVAELDGRLVLAAQAVEGVQLWDVTDPDDFHLLSYLDLEGIDRGDYSGAWWSFWQAPFLYVAGVDSGLYVVDARDPLAPTLAARVLTGALAGLSPAQCFAVGNLLVLMESKGLGLATLDISDPVSPRMLSKVNGKLGYSHIFAGAGKILTSGSVPPRAYVHQVSSTGVITHEATFGLYFDSGGYGSYQDGAFHSGFSDNYVKFDIAARSELGTGTSGREDRDEDFATVLGNLTFAGDDHGSGTALIPHQAAPDHQPPVVEWHHPVDGAERLALTTRFGLSFSDHVDAHSLTPDTLYLERASTGERVEALRSTQMGLVNLSPAEPLSPETQYRLVAEGVRDLAQNHAPRFEALFTTGDGSVGLPPDQVVTAVSSSSVLNTEYRIGTFNPGALVYTDRDFVFEAPHPARFVGQPYVLTANNDKLGFSSSFLEIELAVPAEVHVLYDHRADSLPDWLGPWTDTGEGAATSDADFTVHALRFEPGTVVLGGNNASGASGQDSMYSVVVVPEPVECALTLTPSTGAAQLQATGPAGARYDWSVGEQLLEDAGPSPAVDLPPGRHGVLLTVTDGPRSATCSGVQIVHRPLHPSRAVTSAMLRWLDEDSLVNVNPDNRTVTRVDDGAVRWAAPAGREPMALSVVDGELWALDRAGAVIVRLDPESGAPLGEIALPARSAPAGMVRAPDAVFVSLSATGEVLRLDADGAAQARAFVTPHARGLTWFNDKLYVTRFISGREQGELYVVDPSDLSTTKQIALVYDAGPDSEQSGRGVPNYLSPLRVAPDGTRGFVTGTKANTARGLFRDGEPLTFESRVRPFAAVIDLIAEEELVEARLDVNDRDMIQPAALSPLGDLLFVAATGNDTVTVFERETGLRVSQLDVGAAPMELQLSPSGGRLAVYNHLGRSLSLFDVTDLVSGAGNGIEPQATLELVEDEALEPEVLLGKRVFHFAGDRRMSRDGYISCASCHFEGGHDGQTWDFTQAGEGLRNTITLRGRAGTGHGNVHWTANFDEIQDFENDIRLGFGGEGFLSDEDFELTRDPLGPPKAGRSPELDALAAYVSSLDEVPPSPFRAEDGGTTEAAARGRAVFLAAGCQDCHGGPAFSDFARHDVGTIIESSGQGLGEPLQGAGFETPTLKGIWNTAPYLHDGRADTLEDALRAHGEAPDPDLIAYLLQLDENSPPADEALPVVEPPDDPPPDDEPDKPAPRGPGSEAPACGCGSTPASGAPGALAAGLLLVALRRRRR